MIKGVCVGGPMDGRVYSGNGNKGVLFVDKPAAMTYLYYWKDGQYNYLERKPYEMERDPEKEKKAFEDEGWDIRSLSEVTEEA